MKTAQRRATIYLDPRLHRALRLKAVETGTSASELGNDAVPRTMAEDAEAPATFDKRAKEPNLPFEAVLKDLRRRGKL